MEVINPEEQVIRMTLTEGRYHQIRRMLAALGNRASEIKRIALGPLKIDGIPMGHYREVNAEELAALGHDDSMSERQRHLKSRRRSLQRRVKGRAVEPEASERGSDPSTPL